MKRISKTNYELKLEKFRKISTIIVCLLTILKITTPVVYATEDDPLAVINNLTNFIFEIVQAVGVIMVLFGIVQFGMALKSHDPSQRATSLFTIVGGLIIAFSKVILNSIMG